MPADLDAVLAAAGYRATGACRGGSGYLAAALDGSDRQVELLVVDCSGAAARERLDALRGVRQEHLPRLLLALELGPARTALFVEHVPGPTLAELRRARGPLRDGEGATVAIPVAQALAELHARGVHHGAVGPGTVVVRPDGRPVLVGLEVVLGGTRVAGAGAIDGGSVEARSAQDVRDLVRAVTDVLVAPDPGGRGRGAPPALAAVLAELLGDDEVGAQRVVDRCFRTVEPEPVTMPTRSALEAAALEQAAVGPSAIDPRILDTVVSVGVDARAAGAADVRHGAAPREHGAGPPERGARVPSPPRHGGPPSPPRQDGPPLPAAVPVRGRAAHRAVRRRRVPRQGWLLVGATGAVAVGALAVASGAVGLGSPSEGPTTAWAGDRASATDGIGHGVAAVRASARPTTGAERAAPSGGPPGEPPAVRRRDDPAAAARALTERRALVLASGDADALRTVTVVGGPAHRADAALLRRLEGVRLLGLTAEVLAAETVRGAAGVGATSEAPQDTDQVVVAVTSGLSAHTQVVGRERTEVPARAATEAVLVLRWTAEGWRVWEARAP